MRLFNFSLLLLPSVLTLSCTSTLASVTNESPNSLLLVLQNPVPQPQIPYLEKRHHDLDPRQVQPAAAGAPAQVAAGAAVQPAGGAAAPVAPVAAPNPPAAAAPAAPANPATTAAKAATAPAKAAPPNPATTAATPAAVAPGAVAPGAVAPGAAAPAAPAAGPVNPPVKPGPATALTTAPSPKSGNIGMGTLTGRVGAVRTDQAKSEAGSTITRRGGMAEWPFVAKAAASLLVGVGLGVGILL